MAKAPCLLAVVVRGGRALGQLVDRLDTLQAGLGLAGGRDEAGLDEGRHRGVCGGRCFETPPQDEGINRPGVRLDFDPVARRGEALQMSSEQIRSSREGPQSEPALGVADGESDTRRAEGRHHRSVERHPLGVGHPASDLAERGGSRLDDADVAARRGQLIALSLRRHACQRQHGGRCENSG